MASLRGTILTILKRKNCYSSGLVNQTFLGAFISRNYSNTSIEYTKDRDPAPLFFNNEVQNLLKKLTRVDLNKVYRHKKLENKQLDPPQYKFMTDDELKKTFEEAAERANEMLQMPPVIKVREPIDCILSEDPALQGYDTAKFVFTDITYGISNRDRLIVIRDTDGRLRKADWETRSRMNQIYFPLKGRQIKTPLMFNDEHLNSLLERKEYEFVLDTACVQFEPDDPVYQKITSLTYQHINDQNDFDILRSTRHFGPLAFFLTWFKILDNLLLDLITTSNISECNFVLKLYNRLHEKDAVAIDIVLESENETKLIEKYISEKSNKKGQLELALQSYKELLKQKQELELDLKKAHGVV